MNTPMDIIIEKSDVQLAQKAFWAIPPNGDYHDMVTTHGETRGKALSSLYKEFGDGDSFIEFAESYRLKRERNSDLFTYRGEDESQISEKSKNLILCSVQTVTSSIPGLFLSKKSITHFHKELHELEISNIIRLNNATGPLSYYQFTQKGLKLRAVLFSSKKPLKKCEIENILKDDYFDVKRGIPLSYIKALNEFYSVDFFSDIENENCHIFSGEWGMWWRANGAGYSSKIIESGVFSLKEAREYSEHCGREKHIYYKIIKSGA